ncbi:hypothetical protein DNTS_021762, partial [Danionella cerebrum]
HQLHWIYPSSDWVTGLQCTMVPLLWIVIVVCAVEAGSKLRFPGSDEQWVEFQRWNTNCESDLSFRMKTVSTNGLLVHSNEDGFCGVLQLLIHSGKLSLCFFVSCSESTCVHSDVSINDNQWHRVTIRSSSRSRSLLVDEEKMEAELEVSVRATTVSRLFMGGVPPELSAETSDSVPISFRGWIAELRVNGSEPEVVNSSGVSLELCVSRRTCPNEGECRAVSHESLCVCSEAGGWESGCSPGLSHLTLLKQGAEESVATFRGSEYFHLDLSLKPMQSSSDEVSLFFKTFQRNGLMLHTGTSDDYLHLSLKRGSVSIIVSLGSGAFEALVEPVNGKFNDNQWHEVKVSRSLRQHAGTGHATVAVSVDGVLSTTGYTQDDYSSLSFGHFLFVGGSPSSAQLPEPLLRNSFRGCLRQVVYKNGEIDLDVSLLAVQRDPRVKIHGVVSFKRHHFSDAGIFPHAPKVELQEIRLHFLRLPHDGAQRPTALQPGETHLRNPHREKLDFFSIQLLDGLLYLLLDLGSGLSRILAADRKVNDGEWYHVDFQRRGRSGSVSVNWRQSPYESPGESELLDLDDHLYLGGFPENTPDIGTMATGARSALVQDGYVGCVRDLFVDGLSVDIRRSAELQRVSGVSSSCVREAAEKCASAPCLNGGVCREGWGRYLCDCSGTGFLGVSCQTEARVLSFSGRQLMKVQFPSVMHSQDEDVRLRFRSPRAYGLLLATTSPESSDTLRLELEESRVKLTLNLGTHALAAYEVCVRACVCVCVISSLWFTLLHPDCERRSCSSGKGPQTLFAAHNLNDDEWHTVRVLRRGKSLRLSVDHFPSVEGEISGDHTQLEFLSIEAGILTEQRRLLSAPSSFLGRLQSLVFNRKPLIELCLSGELDVCELTAEPGSRGVLSFNPVTFRSCSSFLTLGPLQAYTSMILFFQIRTSAADGLIIYSGGDAGDFLAVELVDGKLHYISDLGSGTLLMKGDAPKPLNDSVWHSVMISRDRDNLHTLRVDSRASSHSSLGARNLDLTGDLFIGGVPELMYRDLPRLVQARAGFQGCLASLDLNGKMSDLMSDALVCVGQVERGCGGPSRICEELSCANQGICLQGWEDFTCDCSMTSFEGPRCEELLQYFWPPHDRPSTRVDRLALGFLTLLSEATLVRVESAAGLGDFLMLHIEEGRVAAVFNVGTEDISLQEDSKLVNDGEYHTVRFSRNGGNASLQLDDLPAIERFPQEEPEEDRCLFQGQMSGFYYNGLKLFNMALDGDPNVRMEGSVRPLGETQAPSSTQTLHLNETSTSPTISSITLPHSREPETTEELVASAECPTDDEDVQPCEASSADPSVPSPGGEVSPSEVFRESSSTTVMVLGIVLAAALCILILLYAMYKYRNREQASYLIQQQQYCGGKPSLTRHSSHEREERKRTLASQFRASSPSLDFTQPSAVSSDGEARLLCQESAAELAAGTAPNTRAFPGVLNHSSSDSHK